jgi:hypothetical protein
MPPKRKRLTQLEKQDKKAKKVGCLPEEYFTISDIKIPPIDEIICLNEIRSSLGEENLVHYNVVEIIASYYRITSSTTDTEFQKQIKSYQDEKNETKYMLPKTMKNEYDAIRTFFIQKLILPWKNKWLKKKVNVDSILIDYTSFHCLSLRLEFETRYKVSMRCDMNVPIPTSDIAMSYFMVYEKEKEDVSYWMWSTYFIQSNFLASWFSPMYLSDLSPYADYDRVQFNQFLEYGCEKVKNSPLWPDIDIFLKWFVSFFPERIMFQFPTALISLCCIRKSRTYLPNQIFIAKYIIKKLVEYNKLDITITSSVFKYVQRTLTKHRHLYPDIVIEFLTILSDSLFKEEREKQVEKFISTF